MLKKLFILSLVLLLVNLTLAPAIFAKNAENKELMLIEKLQTNIQKQGVGVDSKIKIKLKDGTKLKGYVSEIGDESFTVMDEKTGQNVSVAWSQVKQAQGNNWSTRKTVGIVVLVGVAVLIIAALVSLGSEK